MKKLFLFLGLLSMFSLVSPTLMCAQGEISAYSTDTYKDYDGIVQIISSTRDDWYRVTLFFSGEDVTYIIEGRSPSVSGLYYHETANCKEWIVLLKQYLDAVYGKSNYTIHFGQNRLSNK